MPVAATNETPAVATSAVPVEQANEAPAVATSAIPIEQANEAPVAPNNEMSITVPPHLFGVVPSTTNSMEQINFYADLPLKAFVYADLPLKALVKFNGNEIEINQSIMGFSPACLPQGPPFYKWAIENLLGKDMIETIRSEAPLEAQKLKTLVRGIRPRMDAKANPRKGEPTDYVLVLGDIIQANDPNSLLKNALRAARQMFDKGKLHEYKSACMCNIVHDVNGSVSLHRDIFKNWFFCTVGAN